MANIVPFNFENHEVRFNSLDEGSFEVAAADVARVLGYSDTTNL